MKSSAYLKWLKQWIDGSMTAREEQQLEQAARDDAFLHDALEGLRSAPEEEHTIRLSRLRKKIRQSERREGRIISLAIRRIAAVVLLVLSLSSIWWLNRPVSREEISMQEQNSPALIDTANSPPEPLSEESGTEAVLPEPTEPVPDNYSLDESPPQIVLPRISPTLPQASEALPIESLSNRGVDIPEQPLPGVVELKQSEEQEAIGDIAGNFKMARSQLLSDSIKIRRRVAPPQPLPLGGFSYFRSDSPAYQAFFAGRQAAIDPTTVAFTVYPLGEIGAIEVLNSTNDGQANQVVEYLKNGPKWVLPEGITDSLRTQITIPIQE